MSITLPKIYPVTSHTDFVGKGSIFVAIKGAVSNGVTHIPVALQKGASIIIVQKDNKVSNKIEQQIIAAGTRLEYVSNARKALAELSAHKADSAAQRLKIFAITGTKGKTTTAFVLRALLSSGGYKTALLSTAQNYIGEEKISSELTTPQPDYIHQFLKVCVENGVTHVVMEVSAQALSLFRVYSIEFDGVIFTNFSHEHLEFYKNLDEYFAAKKLLFKQVKKNAPLLINADDEKGRALLKEYPHATSFGIANDTAMHAKTWDANNTLHLLLSHNQVELMCSSLYGTFNASNVLAATSLALKLGISIESIQRALQLFGGVPGRLQELTLQSGARVIIDYAHNPSSYEVLLSCLREKTNQLIVVFGAGGGKDKEKRPKMGAIVARYADKIIITSDNPRYEEQKDIVADIMRGIASQLQEKVIVIDDRKDAIEYACNQANNQAIVAILGKGNDTYQEVAGKKMFFSDEQEVKLL